MGHQNICLRHRNNETVGGRNGGDRGVFQGCPLSAHLFIIYAVSTTGYHGESLKRETGGNTNRIKLGMWQMEVNGPHF